MRFTAKEHPGAIKRYRHLRPARGRRAQRCDVRWPGTSHVCTREQGHRGPHAAHGWFRQVVAVWEPNTRAESAHVAARSAPDAPSVRSAPGRRPIGLRSRSPVGILEGLRSFLARTTGSLEELAFLIFFLVFVGFAIGGFLLIYLG